jgi:hypothetical protein
VITDPGVAIGAVWTHAGLGVCILFRVGYLCQQVDHDSSHQLNWLLFIIVAGWLRTVQQQQQQQQQQQ